jgi:dTDP-4-amino-4,6-dideoxygalactose transaminase
MVTTQDDELAVRLRMLRNHGGTSKFENVMVGTNSRLDALQAALLRVRLAHVGEALEGRLRVAEAYDAQLEGAGIGLPVRAPDRDHVFLFYVVRVPDRDRVTDDLAGQGVSAIAHNPVPVHLQPAVGLGYQPGDLPNAEAACAEALSLPTFPHMRGDQVEYVADALRSTVRIGTVPTR